MKIPGNVTSIGDGAFEACGSLASVTISEKISKIGVEAFKDCAQLKALDIVVSSDVNIQFPQVGRDAFANLPDPVDRKDIRFVNDSGEEVTGQAFIDAFAEAAKNDNDGEDGRWYGWSYKSSSEVKDTYTVTINVKKDGNPWSGHGRDFALLGGGGSGFLEVPGQTGDSSYSISQVPNGTYRVYDVTGISSDSLYSRARDTGMDVRVSGADTEVDAKVDGTDVERDIHYYTVTFYDGAEAYKAGTPQLHITATATEGGIISPTGDIVVTKGGEQTFTITPGEGYKIKTVMVDDNDVTAELKDTLAKAQAGARYYTFTNVT